MTKPLTPVLFTLTALLALVGCNNPNDSGNKDSESCVDTADCPDDTGDPPVTMTLTYLITEFGNSVTDINTNLGNTSVLMGNELTLPAGEMTWLTAGDLANMAPDGVTPLYSDSAGTWATKPVQILFDDVESSLSIFDPEGNEEPLNVWPVVDNHIDLTAPLGTWFDFGAVTCHFETTSGYVNDYEQSDLVVEYGYKFEVNGVFDGASWLEIVDNSFVLAGVAADDGIKLTSAAIDQAYRTLEFSDNGGSGGYTLCQ